jgi:uncharacterized phage infection (PIP) family protein YhgE
MSIMKALFKNKLFLMGLLIPMLWQAVYFSIAIPAVNKADTGVFNLKIEVVNEDKAMGGQITGQLTGALPFKTEVSYDLAAALEDMNNGASNMVIYIPADFTLQLQQGNDAVLSYYINQTAPSMTKQLMETTAKSINQIVNESVFNNIKSIIQESAGVALGQAGLPVAAAEKITPLLDQAFDSLKSTSVIADIQKVNNSEGTVQTAFPLYIFLTFFIGSVIYAVTHSLAYKNISRQAEKHKLYVISLIINIAYAIIVPIIVISFAAGFGISFNQGVFVTWCLLSTGFFTFVSLFQMLFKWLGTAGTGAFILILFPLQLISSGFMYPTEILPSFYRAAADYLPATYFGGGILKAIYGGASTGGDFGILWLMAVIFIGITALALFKKTGKETNAIKI